MRWMWIDRVVELVPGERMVAVKHISLAEEHLHDHFRATAHRPPTPVMPMSLIVEGMAQTAGVLVGHATGFAEKVVLSKVSKAELDREGVPGDTLRYRAEIASLGERGASCRGVVELLRPVASGVAQPEEIGRIDLMFSFADRATDLNGSGLELPEENFVFSEAFGTLLRSSGIEDGPTPIARAGGSGSAHPEQGHTT